MLKLIAIRPLPGCRKSALKCLQVGQMYYLCNDFIISKDSIRLRDDYIRPLPEDFFSLSDKSGLSINISAVVGMNGDGKSSLIELMMRLINNFAKYKKFTFKDRLLRIEGVKAELFYILDNVLYCIRERNADEHPDLLMCTDLSDKSKRDWMLNMAVVKNVSMQVFFYSIISNYSFYAYNTRDFRDEWDENVPTTDQKEKCWLHYLFHKNDGYRTPMTIHPYRDEGNVDVNRENDLTLQRLMALYIQEPNPRISKNSFRSIGEKYADTLLLTDAGCSKLQDKTLIEYFSNAKTASILSSTIRKIEDLIKEGNDIELEKLKDNTLATIELSLDFLTGAKDKKYNDFLQQFCVWVLDKRRMFSSNSDVRLLLNAMKKYNNYFIKEELPFRKYARKYRKFDKLNIKQLSRIKLVYTVLNAWYFPVDIVFKKYEELTDIEKCQHYIVYKTINICETYPMYIDVIEKSSYNGWNGLIFEEDLNIVRDIVSLIDDDISHITLKIRQCFNAIKRFEKDPLWLKKLSGNDNAGNANDNYKYELPIDFDVLRDFYNQDEAFSLDLLPPPIYDAEIQYKHQLSNREYIPYRYLSSGEKQLLNNIGALLYHLRNLDSVADKKARCENVNIVLEEIELYFHPEYQRSIVKMLIEKLHSADFYNIKNINVTFVTHSPFILSDIPMCNVLLLKDGRPAIECMQENTFGSNIHGMLKNGFFLPSLPIGEFAHEKINGLFDRLNRFKLDSRSREQREWFYSNIMRVGEPYIREQLMKLFHMHYPMEYYD